jgi:phosphoketolase
MSSVIAAPSLAHDAPLSDADLRSLHAYWRAANYLSVGQIYHGYPTLIHRLTYPRANHRQIHVRGYKEQGTTTTPFDMLMLNEMDRFHLVMDVIDRVPSLGAAAAELRQEMAGLDDLRQRECACS